MPLSPSYDRPVFDIIRGWPHGGAIEKTLVPSTGVSLVEGDLVEILSTGLADKVTLAAGNVKKVFVVIEGNTATDSYSGNYLGKVVALTGCYEVKTSNFAVGAYAPGLPVTVISGKWALIAAGEPVVGFVTAYDSAAAVLTVVTA